MKRIFLSRDGKSFGPFSSEDIEAMRARGELSAYQWIYDDPEGGWKPIAPPPPTPASLEPEAAPTRADSREWLAILRDERTLVSGVARNASTKGCTVAAEAPETTIPSFRPGAHIILNLLDPERNQAENMKVTVESVVRGAEGWEYILSWNRLPRMASLTAFFLMLCLGAGPAWSAPPQTATSPSPTGAKKLDVDGLKEKYWNNESSPELRVVQNRAYTKELKISLEPFFTVLSADPFQGILGAGVGLGFNFTEYLGVHAIYSRYWSTPSSAANAFLTVARHGANTNPVNHLIGGELSWSILYGKLSLLGKAILHFDLYLHGGGGYLFTNNGNTVAPWAGIGQQIYILKWLTLRADYRFMYWRENIVNLHTPGPDLGQVIGQRDVFAHWLAFGLNFLFP